MKYMQQQVMTLWPKLGSCHVIQQPERVKHDCADLSLKCYRCAVTRFTSPYSNPAGSGADYLHPSLTDGHNAQAV